MSTRSGKRIHITTHNDSAEVEVKTDRKTRSKRQKDTDITVVNVKKRKHYVRYPSEEEKEGAGNSDVTDMTKCTRKTRRQTLKEQNVLKTDSETSNDDPKSVRSTRRTKKFDAPDIIQTVIDKENVEKKKGKKKKSKSLTEGVATEVIDVNVKKSKKKKNKKKSNSIIVEDIDSKDVNKSDISDESFHSAAGSPIQKDSNNSSNKYNDNVNHSPKTNIGHVDGSGDVEIKSAEKFTNKKRKSIVEMAEILSKARNSISKEFQTKSKASLNGVDIKVDIENDAIFEKNSSTPVLNQSLEHCSKKRNTVNKNSSYTITEASMTFEINKSARHSVVIPLNGTFDLISNKKTKTSTNSLNMSTTNLNSTFNREESNRTANQSNSDGMNDLTYSGSKRRKSSIKNSTYDKNDNFTFEIEATNNMSIMSSKNNESIMKESGPSNQTTNLNNTYEKKLENEVPISLNSTFEKSTKLDTTYDKNSMSGSMEQSPIKLNARSSLISSDTTDNCTSDLTDDNCHISITSDDSKSENIVNTTPLLIESSMDESTEKIKMTPKQNTETMTITPLTRQNTFTETDESKLKKTSKDNSPPLRRDGTFTETDTPKKKRLTLSEIDSTIDISKNQITPNKLVKTPSKTGTTPLKREGTFTKESPIGTPVRQENTPRRKSLPSPGCTPFPSSKNHKSVLNVTHSIEKSRRSSIADVPPRLTKVMFCSPVNNPTIVTQMKGKIIKSNLKGSNKSFVFDESVSEVSRSSRKRSYTQSEAEDGGRAPADRSSRARTASAHARLQDSFAIGAPSPKKPQRTKLPNFAALHQKQFERMESLDECQRRRAKRAKRLLTPTAPGRLSPRETPQEPDTNTKKVETPKSKQPDAKPSYTRFGFKLNLDVNPFSIPAKITTTQVNPKIKPNTLKRQATLPSLAGSTTLRKEIAKQTILREKSFTEKRHVKRDENRTVIKGVRTNRRFELQMKMRNVSDK